MGYMALTTHLRPSNNSVGHKRLEHITSNDSNHCSRPLLIEATHDIDNCINNAETVVQVVKING